MLLSNFRHVGLAKQEQQMTDLLLKKFLFWSEICNFARKRDAFDSLRALLSKSPKVNPKEPITIMKMKIRLLLIMMLLSASVSLLVSCGDDDGPGSSLNGTWKRTETDAYGKGTLKFTFKGNSVTYNEFWKSPDGDNEDDTYKGTYAVNEEDGTLAMILYFVLSNGQLDESYPEEWIFEYQIKNKELTLTPLNHMAGSYFGWGPMTYRK